MPVAVTDLAAAQQGDDVILTFTLPKETVETQPLKQSPAIEIFRDFRARRGVRDILRRLHAVPPSAELLVTIPSAMVDQFTIREAMFRYVDSLNARKFLAASGQRSAVYLVRTRTSAKKVSADSNLVPLRDLARARSDHRPESRNHSRGVVLTWTPPQKTLVGPAPPIAAYDIYRAGSEPNNPAAPPRVQRNRPQNKPSFAQIGDLPGSAIPRHADSIRQDLRLFRAQRRAVRPDLHIESPTQLCIESPARHFPAVRARKA